MRVVAPDHATTTLEHSMFETTTRDASGHVTNKTRDLDGRIISTSGFKDAAATKEVRTRYTYGPFDQITLVRDQKGHETKIQHDELGRRWTINDPDFGIVEYHYNGFGEVVTATSIPSLLTNTYKRDALGRVEKIDNGDGPTIFKWDVAPNGIGKLGFSLSPDDVRVDYVYDTYGRTKSTTWTLDASGVTPKTYAIDIDYDPTLGRVDQLRYPDVPGRPRFAVKFAYDNWGYLTEHLDNTDPQNPTSLWKVEGRDVDGSLTKATLGNVVTNLLDYAPDAGRLHSVSAWTGGNDVFGITYGYEENGDVRPSRTTT